MWDKIKRQIRWWQYAAWTAPFVALAILIGEEILGYDYIRHKTAITITIIFISVSVFWWWWAVAKIKEIFECMKRNEETFNEVIQEIKTTQEILKDARNR